MPDCFGRQGSIQGKPSGRRVLSLYFDVSYVNMKPEQEILSPRRSGGGRLTQSTGRRYISIYCGDQPLMDGQGNPVGAVSASDFILNTSNVIPMKKQS